VSEDDPPPLDYDPNREHVIELDGAEVSVGPLAFPVDGLHFEGPPLSEAGADALKRIVGRRVQEARQELGYTQASFAKAAGKSLPWIKGLEGGRTLAPLWLLVALANSLDTIETVDWFFEPLRYGVEAQPVSLQAAELARRAERLSERVAELEARALEALPDHEVE